jgi:hypothetical protein
LASQGYIYRLESALLEACNQLGVEPNAEALAKPEILQRSYLVKKAREEGNREIQNLITTMSDVQEQMKSFIPIPGKEKSS